MKKTMKNRLVAALVTGMLSCSLLVACGSGSKDSGTSSATTDTTGDTASDSTTTDDTTAATDGTFSLGDVTADMLETGMHAVDDDGNDVVFVGFTGPDSNSYVTLLTLSSDGTGSVICGQYTASQSESQADDGTALTDTTFSGTDLYSGRPFTIGTIEGDNGDAVIYDADGNSWTAEYLDTDTAMSYIETAAGIVAANGQ